jgi:hypothetical protein
MLIVTTGLSQYSYRTFSQQDLAEKKAKPGRILRTQVCFTFHNTTDSIMNGLYARFNSEIVSFQDSGGFTSFSIGRKHKAFEASGRSILPGDSVSVCLTVRKKSPGTHANAWWWMIDGSIAGGKHRDLFPTVDNQVINEPNGGYVLDYLYRKVVTRPAGLLVGIPDPSDVGWIRFMKADRKYFPHTGLPRCFDYLATGLGGQRSFVGERKNLHVKRHNNHLLGELHALKLAIIANDRGATEPLDSVATLFGDLLYSDSANSSDPFNGMTVRSIAHLADSALTFCSGFPSQTYSDLDNCIARLNSAFDGAYIARSLHPLVLAGTVDLGSVPFLHLNPAVAPNARTLQGGDITGDLPDGFALYQNYPNPFNPTTSIDFSLPVSGFVTLKVYNLLGQEVATLLDNVFMDEGEDGIEFDATDLSSGMYMYRISVTGQESQKYSAVRHMMLVK